MKVLTIHVHPNARSFCKASLSGSSDSCETLATPVRSLTCARQVRPGLPRPGRGERVPVVATSATNT